MATITTPGPFDPRVFDSRVFDTERVTYDDAGMPNTIASNATFRTIRPAMTARRPSTNATFRGRL